MKRSCIMPTHISESALLIKGKQPGLNETRVRNRSNELPPDCILRLKVRYQIGKSNCNYVERMTCILRNVRDHCVWRYPAMVFKEPSRLRAGSLTLPIFASYQCTSFARALISGFTSGGSKRKHSETRIFVEMENSEGKGTRTKELWH